MLAFDLIKAVAHHRQKVFVSIQDIAVQIELNHRLRRTNRLKHTLQKRTFITTFGNVAGKLDDLDQLTLAVKHRIVCRFQPKQLTIFALAREGTA